MDRLVRAYAPSPLKHVVDVGSYDVNGTYREIFTGQDLNYAGLDLSAGPGVDIVLPDPYEFPFAGNSIDLVLSGQTLEHSEYPWRLFFEMVRIVRPGGTMLLVAPCAWPQHRYPVDCWRILPDGFRSLAKLRPEMTMLEVGVDERGAEGDSWAAMRKEW